MKRTIESVPHIRQEQATLCNALFGLSLTGPLVLTGCSHGPEFSIFGSFFPVWIFCSFGGLALAAGVRALVARTAIAEYVAAPAFCYLCIAIFLACMLWLPFYS